MFHSTIRLISRPDHAALLAAVSVEIVARGGWVRESHSDPDTLSISSDFESSEIADIFASLSKETPNSDPPVLQNTSGPSVPPEIVPVWISAWIKEQIEDHLNETRKAGAVELRDYLIEALLGGEIPSVAPLRAIWLVSQLRNLDVSSPLVLDQLRKLTRKLGANENKRLDFARWL